MKKVKLFKTMYVVAALAAVGFQPAQAGFVDARGDKTGAAGYLPPPAMNAAPSLPFVATPLPAVAATPPVMAPGRVAGDLANKLWKSKLGKPPRQPVDINKTIRALIPTFFIAKGLEIDDEISTDQTYKWNASRSRLDNLREVATIGNLYINVSARDGVSVQRANPLPRVPATPVVVAPPVPREPVTPAPVFGPTTSPRNTPAVTYGPTPNSEFLVRANGTSLPPLSSGGPSPAMAAPASAAPSRMVATELPAAAPVMVKGAPLDVAPAMPAIVPQRATPLDVAPQFAQAVVPPNPAPLTMAAPEPSMAQVYGPGSAFSVAPGQRLMPSLKGWLTARGVELSWEASGSTPGRIRDVVVDSPLRASSTDIPSVLNEVLTPFGFEAQIQQGSPLRVVVKNASLEGYQQ